MQIVAQQLQVLLVQSGEWIIYSYFETHQASHVKDSFLHLVGCVVSYGLQDISKWFDSFFLYTCQDVEDF